jgi:hypothetical protein
VQRLQDHLPAPVGLLGQFVDALDERRQHDRTTTGPSGPDPGLIQQEARDDTMGNLQHWHHGEPACRAA